MDSRVTDLVADGEDVADHAILLELVDGDVAGIWFGLLVPECFISRHRVGDLGLQEGGGQCLPLSLGLVSLSSLGLTVGKTHRAEEAGEASSRHGRMLSDVQALARKLSCIKVLLTHDLRPVGSVPVEVVDSLDLPLGKVQFNLDFHVVKLTLTEAVGSPL